MASGTANPVRVAATVSTTRPKPTIRTSGTPAIVRATGGSGPAGATGASGPTGATGATGATGPSGGPLPGGGSDGNVVVKSGTGSVWGPTPVAQDELMYNVAKHSLVGDAIQLDDIYITSGTNQVASPSANFTVADIGKCIAIMGAGVAGAGLNSSPSGNVRTIASVIDANTITFDDPAHGVAGTTVVAARTCTVTTTRGTNVITSADAAFTSSDVGKSISIPLCFGDDLPTLKTQFGAITAASFTLTSTYAVFTTADVGKYVRVGRAGASGAFLVAKITARASSTSVTLDTAATATVTGAEVVDLGVPKTQAVTIVGVASGTSATIRRFADFPVTTATSSISGGSLVYGTNNQAAMATILAAVPDYTTLYVPAGTYFVANSSLTLGRPVTIRGDHKSTATIHFGASSGRLIAGASNVTFDRMGFKMLLVTNGSIFGNAAAGSNFTDWTFRDCLFTGGTLALNRQNRVGDSGTVTSTGTGHSTRLRLERTEHVGAMGSTVTLSSIDHATMISGHIHDSGILSSTSVGFKADACRHMALLDTVCALNIGDGVDIYDCHAPTVNNLRGWMNGVKLFDFKWGDNTNYNSPERAVISNIDAWCNWGGGMNLSAPRLAVTNVKCNGNDSFGIQRAKGTTATVAQASLSTFTNIECSGNSGSGISATGGVSDTWQAVHAHGNGASGFFNGGSDTILIAVQALLNQGPVYAGTTSGGIYHSSTAVRPRQQMCATQDTNGQFVAGTGSTFILANNYGEEAGLTAGASPTLASWPVGALVCNTTATATYWRRTFSAWVAGTTA